MVRLVNARNPSACVLAAAGALAAAGVLAGCQPSPGGLGDPCLPESEYYPLMNGFALGEVYVETRSFQCESRVCLVNHFQGRVSCPYGQTQADLTKPGNAPERCRVPGTTGDDPSEQVRLPVAAWNTARPPATAVYCSCRCHGPDAEADYCECPSGFVCEPLTPTMNLAARQLEGSYCIKAGTHFEAADAAAPSCREDPAQGTCPGPLASNP
jgi:hypothetical protein